MFLRWKSREHATAIQRGRARCDHAQDETVLWTPVLLHSERRDGVSRHVQIARLTSIRGCCIEDPAARATWWIEIFRDLDAARERGVLGDPDADPRVRPILEALSRVVPFERVRHRSRVARAQWARRPAAATARTNETVNESNCFSILGVSARCSALELKRAWRRAAGDHHPDRGGDDASFRRVTLAYELCRKIRGLV